MAIKKSFEVKISTATILSGIDKEVVEKQVLNFLNNNGFAMAKTKVEVEEK